MAVWTFDTTHFTLDSALHRMDGWHVDHDVPSQDASWTETSPSGNPWTEIIPTQDSSFSEIEPDQDANWVDGSISN